MNPKKSEIGSRIYSDSYSSKTWISKLAEFVHLALNAIPKRARYFLHYSLVRSLQREVEAELISKIGARSHSPLLKAVDFSPLLKNPKFGFSLGTSGILGTWESQVQKVILNRAPFDLFIDIGAANELYLVGALKSGAAERAIAYEALELSRESISHLASGNSVTIDIRGTFSLSSLKEISHELSLSKRTLVLVDIEGAESELLSDELISELASHKGLTLIVEMHPHLSGNQGSEELARRLSSHFKVEELRANSINMPDELLQILEPRPDWEIFALLSEQRQIWMTWMVCTN